MSGEQEAMTTAAAASEAASKPAWGGWKPAAVAPARTSLTELMDEQLAERLQDGDRPAAPPQQALRSGSVEEAAALDPDLALALALSLSEAQQAREPESAAAATLSEKEEVEADPDLVLARRLAAEEEAAQQEGEKAAMDADMALAMLLQEEERTAAEAAREARERRARQQLGDLGQQYSKVQLAFHQEAAALPVGGGGGRVLLGEADAQDEEEDDEEEGMGDDDPLGLSGLSVVGAGGGRRRRRGELLRTAGGSVITKHDPGLNARVNALDLAARYQGVGDLEGEVSMRVPNKAYNALKHDLRRQAGTLKGVSARGKMETSARATQEGVLDARTRLIIYKIINRGTLIREMQGVVKTGKESAVYYAPSVPAPTTGVSSPSSTFVVGGPGATGAAAAQQQGGGRPVVVDLTGSDDEAEEQEAAEVYGDEEEGEEEATTVGSEAAALPEWDRERGCAIKLYYTTLNQFSNRKDYVEGDPRYHESLKFNKQTSRRMFTLWAEKEFRNLVRMHRAGIPCPVPLEQKEHVLILSFLGEDGWPAPQLREAKMGPKAWAKCYRRVCAIMRDMCQKAGLVHGDLSEYNLLLHEGRPHVIDVGQSVKTTHPRATWYLKRDIEHVNAFFRRHVGDGEVVPDGALLSFVRMRRPRDHGEGAGEGEDGEQGAGEGDEEEEDEEVVVEGILERLMEGQAFEAAVAGSGFSDPGGRAGQEEEEGDGADEEEV